MSDLIDLLKRVEHLARDVPVFSEILPSIREAISAPDEVAILKAISDGFHRRAERAESEIVPLKDIAEEMWSHFASAPKGYYGDYIGLKAVAKQQAFDRWTAQLQRAGVLKGNSQWAKS